jgi:hypothetical protein
MVPYPHHQSRLARGLFCLFVAALVPLNGCDSLERLRRLMRGEGAGVRLTVVPAHGLVIVLDGKQVGTDSPYENNTLEAGSHLLEIHAPAYSDLTLSFDLAVGQKVTIPLELRRDEGANGALATHEVTPPGKSPMAAPPEPPARPLAAMLPPGVSPVVVSVTSEPRGQVLLDGRPAATLRLERVAGTLAVGGAELGYRISGASLLDLTLPNDDAAWTRDGSVMLPGNSFRLLHGTATRLMRTTPDGAIQVLLLRREGP